MLVWALHECHRNTEIHSFFSVIIPLQGNLLCATHCHGFENMIADEAASQCPSLTGGSGVVLRKVETTGLACLLGTQEELWKASRLERPGRQPAAKFRG